MEDKKLTLLIDFDGVMHDYKGWDGSTPTGGPILKARAALYQLESNFRLICFTTRPEKFVTSWLLRYGFPSMKVTNIKEPAFLILDDRAITFTGEWTDGLLEQIKNFKPYWQTTESQL